VSLSAPRPDRYVAAMQPMVAVGFMLFAGCGRMAIDPLVEADHLHAADGWSIELLVDFTGTVQHRKEDFLDTAEPGRPDVWLDNAPSYVAALYPPFEESLVVIAGRSLIAISAEGDAMDRSYSPKADGEKAPDAPKRATFADLGPDKVGLWVTSESQEGGDGLFLLQAEAGKGPERWKLEPVNDNNNTYALGRGSVDGTTALYVGNLGVGEPISIDRLIEGETAATPVWEAEFGEEVVDIAVVGDTLFVTTKLDADPAPRGLSRIDPGDPRVAYELLRDTELLLAEGSTDAGLFAIYDQRELVLINQNNGTLDRKAWSDDPGSVWRAVSAPRRDHRWLAGKLVVLESNGTIDRLLLITPPAAP
jgi:hypothetical protein